jgi:hypothetical protein
MSVQYRAPHCQKRPKLLIQIQSDMETFGHSIDFDLKVRRASKHAIEFAIPFWITTSFEPSCATISGSAWRATGTKKSAVHSRTQFSYSSRPVLFARQPVLTFQRSEARLLRSLLEVLRRIDTEWVCVWCVNLIAIRLLYFALLQLLLSCLVELAGAIHILHILKL